MLPEISLNILDVTQNSISAQATIVDILVAVDRQNEELHVRISDNGKGMSPEVVEHVTDPFYTTRTTRKVGLGIPFLKQAAQATGGTFSIESEVGVGTVIDAVFMMNHIDCMPLGDICGTIHSLVILNQQIDFVFMYKVDDKEFVLDTRQMKEILGNVSFQEPEISAFISDYLTENKTEVEK